MEGIAAAPRRPVALKAQKNTARRRRSISWMPLVARHCAPCGKGACAATTAWAIPSSPSCFASGQWHSVDEGYADSVSPLNETGTPAKLRLGKVSWRSIGSRNLRLMMSKKSAGQRQPPTVEDVARVKSGFAKKLGGSAPPPAHVRRIERAAAKVPGKGGR
jgi:hypothetical protein